MECHHQSELIACATCHHELGSSHDALSSIRKILLKDFSTAFPIIPDMGSTLQMAHSLEGLPSDLLHKIISELLGVHHWDPVKQIGNLRLTSRAMNAKLQGTFGRKFFSELFVTLDHNCMERVNLIARHAYYATLVTRLCVIQRDCDDISKEIQPSLPPLGAGVTTCSYQQHSRTKSFRRHMHKLLRPRAPRETREIQTMSTHTDSKPHIPGKLCLLGACSPNCTVSGGVNLLGCLRLLPNLEHLDIRIQIRNSAIVAQQTLINLALAETWLRSLSVIGRLHDGCHWIDFRVPIRVFDFPVTHHSVFEKLQSLQCTVSNDVTDDAEVLGPGLKCPLHAALASMPSLQELSLTGPPKILQHLAVGPYVTAKPPGSSLRRLDLFRVQFQIESADEFLECHRSTLQILSLFHCHLNPRARRYCLDSIASWYCLLRKLTDFQALYNLYLSHLSYNYNMVYFQSHGAIGGVEGAVRNLHLCNPQYELHIDPAETRRTYLRRNGYPLTVDIKDKNMRPWLDQLMADIKVSGKSAVVEINPSEHFSPLPEYEVYWIDPSP